MGKTEQNPSAGEAEKVSLSKTEEFGFVNLLKGIGLDEISASNLVNREDTKYILPFSLLPRIFAETAGRYLIQEINGERIAAYETIYYDSPGLQFFHDHVNGKLNHCKVRRRSYTDRDLHFLEVTSKNNKGKTIKERIRIYSDPDSFDQVAADHILRNAGIDPGILTPRLMNRFYRVTLVDLDLTERVTIDFDLTFSKFGDEKTYRQENLAVMEIKQDKAAASFLRDVLSGLRIKESGISKYCLGMALTGQVDKVNYLKNKIRRIQKIITNEYIT